MLPGGSQAILKKTQPEVKSSSPSPQKPLPPLPLSAKPSIPPVQTPTAQVVAPSVSKPSFLSNLFKRKTEAQKLEAAEKKYATATTKLQTATQKSEQAWNESIRVAKSKESLASFAVADVKSMFAGLKRKIAERNQQAAAKGLEKAKLESAKKTIPAGDLAKPFVPIKQDPNRPLTQAEKDAIQRDFINPGKFKSMPKTEGEMQKMLEERYATGGTFVGTVERPARAIFSQQ